MLISCLRIWFSLAALVASLQVTAAPRYWTLTDVQFSDGAVATGAFSYDDATQKIANWNVRVGPGPAGDLAVQGFTHAVQGFTYVPGNSTAWSSATARGPLVFALPFRVCEEPPDSACTEGTGLDFYSDYPGRTLYIMPLVALDGSNATVAIDTQALNLGGLPESMERFGLGDRDRRITAGSLVLTPLPPSAAIVQVDEFYHPFLRHYFITASDGEKHALDTGVHGGWVRTGESFKAYASASITGDFFGPPGTYRFGGYVNPVCRYYGDPLLGLNSHFHSADAAECALVQVNYGSDWQMGVLGDWRFESDNVFQIALPVKATGACPAGTIPVYRLWNARANSNHRYTTSLAIKAEMLAAGYLAEGYGPDGVVMCAVQG